MKGIYKITSPTNKIYVGQSINIERRKRNYAGLNCKKQVKLYASLKKYGFDNHSFEIIEECEERDLNKREKYWIKKLKLFNTSKGLNLSSGGLNCRVSEETKKKISNANKGNKRPDLAKRNRSNKGKPSPFKGVSNKKIIGRKHTKDTIDKMVLSAKNRGQRTIETRQKMSESAKEKKWSKDHKEKIKNWFKSGKARRKIVVDLETGIFYSSAKEACDLTEYKYDYFKSMLNGSNRNKTKYIYSYEN